MKTSGKHILLILLLWISGSCNWVDQDAKNPTNDTQELLDADRSFSDMTHQIGIKKAFIEFINEEGVLLRPENPPLVGPEAIDYLSLINEDNYKLSWRPTGAKVSKSGDMGFTYGIYTLEIDGDSLHGTYVNVWQREADGTWKYVLNNTNESTSANE